jgi:hypothetical protein
MTNFEVRMEEEPSIDDEAERQAKVDAFANSKHAMSIDVNAKTETFNCELKVTNIKKITNIKYEVKLDGNDEVAANLRGC